MNKNKIKIVKRTEAAGARSKKRKVKSQRTAAREAAREIVSTVTDWVSDLKQRKSEETKAAFDLLFSANQRPRES
jgi:hypothetical protein